VVNFYDEHEVEAVYYPEVERLVQAVTGAAKVVVFDHTRRCASAARQRRKRRSGEAENRSKSV